MQDISLELMQIVGLFEKLVELFGGTITIIFVLIFVYFKFLKKGNILVIGNNNKKEDVSSANFFCKQRLDHCDDRFDGINERLERGEKRFSENFKTMNEIHTNVAVLMERTEHLRRIK